MWPGRRIRTVFAVLCIAVTATLVSTPAASAEANTAAVSHVLAPSERDSFDAYDVCASGGDAVLAADVLDALPTVGTAVAQLAVELVGGGRTQLVSIEVEGLQPAAACCVGVTRGIV